MTTLTNSTGFLSTSTAALYTCPSNTASIISGSFCNVTSSPITLTIKVSKSSGQEVHLVKDLVISPGFTYSTKSNLSIILNPGDIFKGSTSVNSGVDFFLAITNKDQ